MSESDSLTPGLLPEEIRSHRPLQANAKSPARLRGSGVLTRALAEYLEGREDFEDAWRDVTRIVEETIIRKALEARSLSQRELAKKLGLSRVTLRKKLREHGLT